jgi:hypothetical protein
LGICHDFFALFLCPINCTVLNRLKRPFSGNILFNQYFPSALAPFPLPNFSAFFPTDFSVEEQIIGERRSGAPVRGIGQVILNWQNAYLFEPGRIDPVKSLPGPEKTGAAAGPEHNSHESVHRHR